MANRAFIRFRNITIPNYSLVSDVFVRFTAFSNKSGTPVNLKYAFVNEDNPTAPTSYEELQAYSLTDWVEQNNLDAWEDGIEYDSPDLTDILQDIVQRDGWESGNSVILIVEDASSSERRGFSSIQFNDGDERAVLFADYTAREATTQESLYVVTEQLGSFGVLFKRALVRKSNGDLVCVYSRDGVGYADNRNYLCVAVSTDGGDYWNENILYTTIDETITPSIALDSNENVHIVFLQGYWGDYTLKYCAWNFSGSPAIETIVSSAYVMNSPSIAIDSNDVIHLVYGYRATYADKEIVKYRSYVTSWSSTTNLSNSGDGNRYCQIAVDSNDYLHVVFSEPPVGETYPEIMYRRYTGSWGSIETVSSGEYSQILPSIAIDDNDHVHISWVGSVGLYYKNIYYAKRTTSWGAPVGLSIDLYLSNAYNSISIDGDGNVYVLATQWLVSDYMVRIFLYDGSWQIPQVLSLHGVSTARSPELISRVCEIGGVKTNRPATGYAMVYNGTVNESLSGILYYASDDLTWDS